MTTPRQTELSPEDTELSPEDEARAVVVAHTTGPEDGWPKESAHGSLGDTTERRLAGILYWPVLVVAAAVDAATFYQVVALVMRNESWVVWTVVAGFTVLALALAHTAGARARQRAEEHFPAVTSPTAWIAFLVWLSMGLAAFAVRYIAPGTNEYDYATDTGGGGGSGGSTALQALLFLTVYLATGAVAGLAGYNRPNPRIRQLRRATRLERRASERVARAEHAHQSVVSLLGDIDETIRTRAEAFAEADGQVVQMTDRLKQEASVMIEVERHRRRVR